MCAATTWSPASSWWGSGASGPTRFCGLLRNDVAPGQDCFYGPGEFALTPAHAEVLHEPAPGDGSVRYLFVGDGPFDFIVDGVDLYGRG